ncbi:MAG: TIGR00296 family protein [Promethearchaeota archaeon]|nr:MAG: TIGR00296 family protein [Candidatus Lokiarchaeota archaeon]
MLEDEKFTREDGELLIKFARDNIKNYLKTNKRMIVPDKIKKKFGEKYGAFVTLNKIGISGNPLRGCIGHIEPKFPLYETVHKVSVSSATEDPRFPSVSLEELDKLTIELSILTPPELMDVDNPQEYLEQIQIGRDGLIIERGMRRGLLLPQVPVDHDRDWDKKTFLEQTCRKAWLPKDSWKDESTKVYKFSAILFEETEPNGKVVRKYIGTNED